jgi:hypothetical protein
VGVPGRQLRCATPTRTAIGLSRPTQCAIEVAGGRLSPWRSTPRGDRGLVQRVVQPGGGAHVVVTARGRALLQDSGRASGLPEQRQQAAGGVHLG